MEAVNAPSNESKWHQTEGGSQLHEKEFIDKLGRFGEGPEIDDVLKGNFEFPLTTSDATREYINACKQPENMDIVREIPNVIDRYKLTKLSWKKRRESTCTDGQHVGHYQAAFIHTLLGWLLFQRGDIPAITGYSPKRHKACVDLQILKKDTNI